MSRHWQATAKADRVQLQVLARVQVLAGHSRPLASHSARQSDWQMQQALQTRLIPLLGSLPLGCRCHPWQQAQSCAGHSNHLPRKWCPSAQHSQRMRPPNAAESTPTSWRRSGAHHHSVPESDAAMPKKSHDATASGPMPEQHRASVNAAKRPPNAGAHFLAAFSLRSS